jgi:hypothetical protein
MGQNHGYLNSSGPLNIVITSSFIIFTIHDYYYCDQNKEDEMGGGQVYVAGIGEMRNPYEVFGGKPEGKRSLGRHRHGWDDNIKMDIRVKRL